ncbi:histidinol dehydrogenase [Flocculibacter collagenilyticus]|uniref:histidinol dehydrogenase n=1 Tax=Flocculibacter collagenilyticus TaxID=2744479 RepID=UPI0018F5BEA4|nr:histidinol dehydrogenase [Flocculibacter collagenilyticus]
MLATSQPRFNATDWNTLTSNEQMALLARPAMPDDNVLSINVKNIINTVKEDGDIALRRFTEKFDGVQLTNIKVPEHIIQQRADLVDTNTKSAIDFAYDQIFAFHVAQVADTVNVENINGVKCELRTAPIQSVGLYIPGGSAPLPSTVLMLGIPAQIAKCQRVVLVTPPNGLGDIAPEILYAAKKCGIREVYSLGGAQAIAALAYGTESINSVDKIFGPGNRYVTEAKQQISQDPQGAAIDMPAGPSELMIIADETANADFVAADLLSQAEHGADSQVMLVSTSATLISATLTALELQLSQLSRAAIAKCALENSRFILVNNLDEAISICNLYAPEHLIIQTEGIEDITSDKSASLLEQVNSAASVFVGAYTPESAGDYASGTNHVLPTYGYSKVLSSLSLVDFTRRYTVQTITPKGLQQLAPSIMRLAKAEGLSAHENAVAIRLANINAEVK